MSEHVWLQTGPSLLNLGNMSSSGGHLSSYNDGYGNSRNFPDRRRGRMENRRPEPYNKVACCQVVYIFYIYHLFGKFVIISTKLKLDISIVILSFKLSNKQH